MALLLCVGCELNLRPKADGASSGAVSVERYDRIQSLYLTTGDFSALQQMNTTYPMQTRTLIEDVLKIGRVNDPEINSKFLNFYQDTVLQSLINEVEQQYVNMDDVNKGLNEAFSRFKKEMPSLEYPQIYAQIGALDQSIIVGNNTLGISLDKYLGTDYPLYKKFYPEAQRRLMTRDMIVPDCMVFYILSLFPMPHDKQLSQLECDLHMGKILWVVNRITQKKTFRNKFVKAIDRYMKKHKFTSMVQLLEDNNYSKFSAN
jgi:hypothetical protein